MEHAGSATQALVASAPDPDRTHLALDFDRTMESIIWAARDAGYSFQRHWIPWKSTAEKDLSLLADRQCQRARAEERKREPGVLAFSSPNGTSPLVVSVVGETPTAGVNMEQLERATHHIRGLSGNSRLLELNVVGPSFSGSLRPLAFKCVNCMRMSHSVSSPAW